MKKDCFGCNQECSNYSNNNGSCPCTECVVKMMCMTDGCENWNEWNEWDINVEE